MLVVGCWLLVVGCWLLVREAVVAVVAVVVVMGKWCAQVKQEQWIPTETLMTFTPRTRGLVQQLDNTPQSRVLLQQLLRESHGVHGRTPKGP